MHHSATLTLQAWHLRKGCMCETTLTRCNRESAQYRWADSVLLSLVYVGLFVLQRTHQVHSRAAHWKVVDKKNKLVLPMKQHRNLY